jgi:NADH dehydrogenase FAD-containing subunit
MSRLLLVGAGHAHMTLMENIPAIRAKGHEVVVIGPGERHYYSGMGPGMLGGDYKPQDISFPVKRTCEQAGATFLVDKCVGIKPEEKLVVLESGQEISYDVASFNTGSSIVDDVVEEGSTNVYRVKPIENLLLGRERLMEMARKDHVRVAVIGGGPAGVEVAGNAWACGQEAGGNVSVALFHGKTFMSRAPDSVRELCRKALIKHGIELVGGGYVRSVSTGKVMLDNGQQHSADIIFIAMGVRPRPLFEPSGIPAGPDGGMLVNKYLQSPKYPDIFGGGDCIWFEPQPLDKVGVYAVRENPVLYHNVVARLEGAPLMEFSPGGDYLLIYNTGGRTGVLHKFGIRFGGSLAFRIKDYIDSAFMKKFKPEYERTGRYA